jgi:hypothetical protein
MSSGELRRRLDTLEGIDAELRKAERATERYMKAFEDGTRSRSYSDRPAAAGATAKASQEPSTWINQLLQKSLSCARRVGQPRGDEASGR